MKRAVCSAAAVLGVIALSLTTVSTVQAPRPSPTFAKDVAPIMFDKCAGCHRPGEVAPMPLLSYEDARPWASAGLAGARSSRSREPDTVFELLTAHRGWIVAA